MSMKVNEIRVSAGRTFNHPYESYSNLRFDVHLNAKLDEGEDPVAATRQLQAQAEEMAGAIAGVETPARRTQAHGGGPLDARMAFSVC
jgi:hypothetical protein